MFSDLDVIIFCERKRERIGNRKTQRVKVIEREGMEGERKTKKEKGRERKMERSKEK